MHRPWRDYRGRLSPLTSNAQQSVLGGRTQNVPTKSGDSCFPKQGASWCFDWWQQYLPSKGVSFILVSQAENPRMKALKLHEVLSLLTRKFWQISTASCRKESTLAHYVNSMFKIEEILVLNVLFKPKLFFFFFRKQLKLPCFSVWSCSSTL